MIFFECRKTNRWFALTFNEKASLLAAVLAHRPQPWAWPRPRPAYLSPAAGRPGWGGCGAGS
jgi:hypothetical protein